MLLSSAKTLMRKVWSGVRPAPNLSLKLSMPYFFVLSPRLYTEVYLNEVKLKLFSGERGDTGSYAPDLPQTVNSTASQIPATFRKTDFKVTVPQ